MSTPFDEIVQEALLSVKAANKFGQRRGELAAKTMSLACAVLTANEFIQAVSDREEATKDPEGKPETFWDAADERVDKALEALRGPLDPAVWGSL